MSGEEANTRSALEPALELPDDFTHDTRYVHATPYSTLYKVDGCDGDSWGRSRLAVKRLRSLSVDEKLFIEEISAYRKLVHANILPLLHYGCDRRMELALVSEWISNGSAWSYVQDHPDRDILRLLISAAEGVAYIHKNQLVHSGITADNILVSHTGDALICDFGIQRAVSRASSMENLSRGPIQMSRVYYSAPELLKNGAYSFETDIWAFGMTIYELAARRRPYEGQSEREVLRAIMGSEFPVFPPGEEFSNQMRNIFGICKDCWRFVPENRADAASVLKRLQQISSDALPDTCSLKPSGEGARLNFVPVISIETLGNQEINNECLVRRNWPARVLTAIRAACRWKVLRRIFSKPPQIQKSLQ